MKGFFRGMAVVCFVVSSAASGQECPPMRPGSPPTREEVQSCIKRAESGDIRAQLTLGALYLVGTSNLPQDLDKAQQWHRRAAEAGSAEAQYRLGVSAGIVSNSEASLAWLEKAAIQGHEEAFNHARGAMSRERIEDRNYAPGIIRFLKTVSERSTSEKIRSDAKRLLGYVTTEFGCSEYAKAGIPDDPIVEFRDAMRLGCIQEIWSTIIKVNEGVDTKQDSIRAGDMWGQFWEKYLAPPADKSGGRALSLLKAAAERRIPAAMLQLSDVYAKGLHGEKVDGETSKQWKKRAESCPEDFLNFLARFESDREFQMWNTKFPLEVTYSSDNPSGGRRRTTRDYTREMYVSSQRPYPYPTLQVQNQRKLEKTVDDEPRSTKVVRFSQPGSGAYPTEYRFGMQQGCWRMNSASQ